MRHDVFISGFGGQGVLLAGNLLGYAAMGEGKNVSFYPSYGVEKRGGAAMCTVVIADGEVGSPVVGNPSVSVILNQTSFDKYASRVKPGGVCIVNTSLVEIGDFSRSDIELIPIPMNEIAMQLGDLRMVNMVAVGAYAAKTGAVSLQSLEGALRKTLPERNHRFIPANVRAIEAGAQRSGSHFLK
ncbi:Pyruvate/ketoisovalerate oxidoreductase [Geobacter metallireducens RCH3]|uniref:2-oxoacid:ferredoxin oxidoreductase, gamma subunit n=1 Tax=Geobacter metallireducens (strain ATCC 53774 / DSM 7210 / GS-15) TaxID=269799 RepID=Q39W29_GEOMG|nr:2-oxoacid:acceptor oxidoreductase family protein [Geobacter metallireducens]ABB31545.1 2-oxoacid:ferredoxin oxidoreductase, gamma subunit [Geobacter metallireducens GS-15]EHP88364.1 Pyruvate/ketoisovalerate oxidoreductase [Geobacter metallireducens RCH3]